MNDDADGTPIPEAIECLWNCQRVHTLVSDLNYIIHVLQEAKAENSIQFLEVNLMDSIALAKQLKAQLERAIPYAVCPVCQGALNGSCKLCKGRGAISKFLWDSPAVSAEIKRMRAKVKH